MENATRRSPSLLILAGPSGTGKTTLCERMVEIYAPGLRRVVTATTRPPRPGERDGVDYHFLSPEAFTAEVEAGGFYEWAWVHGKHRYGTLKREIAAGFAARQDLIMNIDVQGAASFRKAEREEAELQGRVCTVFIHPESLDQIRERLRLRQDAEVDIARRMETATREVQEASAFDHSFVSGTREHDLARLRAIFEARQRSE